MPNAVKRACSKMVDGHSGHFIESIAPIRAPLYHRNDRSYPTVDKRYNGYMSQFESLENLMQLWHFAQDDTIEDKRDALNHLEYI